MAHRQGHPPRSLLDPTDCDTLRGALERLRANGLSRAEAAAELLRRKFYDFVDAEVDADTQSCPRLRIIKR